jgi:thioredoxin-related protein
MVQILVAVVLVVVAVAVAAVLRRRRQPEAPTQGGWTTPTQLDRADFARPDASWLIAVFSSGTCNVCADIVSKAQVMAAPDVAVQEVEYASAKALHRRYRIDAVPLVVLADAEGVVRASFIGPVSATDLWAAFAEARALDEAPGIETAETDQN